MKILLFLLPITLLTACSNEPKKDKAPGADTAKQSTAPVVTINTDTMVVDKDAAVFYSPDTAQLAKWKKEVGEDKFATVIDDWSFYMNSSGEYLKTTTLSIQDASDKKVLKFVKADGSATMIRLDTISNFWGVYLFTPAKEPKHADLIMFQEEHKSYFK